MQQRLTRAQLAFRVVMPGPVVELSASHDCAWNRHVRLTTEVLHYERLTCPTSDLRMHPQSAPGIGLPYRTPANGYEHEWKPALLYPLHFQKNVRSSSRPAAGNSEGK